MRLKMSKKLALEIVEDAERGVSAYMTWIYSNEDRYYRHNSAVISEMLLAHARRVLVKKGTTK